MSHRAVISAAAACILGIACISTEALALRGGGVRGGARAGGIHGAYHGAYHGGAYRGAYARRGWGVGVGAAAVGAAAVGAAIAAPTYYNSVTCGYYPNPPCY
jgi:hypothetical protein